ncbi:MAG TPA: hypothetical protein VF147_06155 [Vicinamibacterales bacterium]
MMTRSKLVLTAFVALIVCLGLGYAWGASGRLTIQGALDDTKQQLDLAEARGHILDARVSLYNSNFGDAAARFEDAKAPLKRVKERYQEAGRSDAASGIDAALGHVEEAKRLAGKLDQGANNPAGEALEAIKVATSKS